MMEDRTWAFDAITNRRVHGVNWPSVTLLLLALEVSFWALEDLENTEDAGVPEWDLWENMDGIWDWDCELTMDS